MEYFCSPLQLNHRILSNSSCTVHEPVRVYLVIGIPMYVTLSKLVPLSHISGINSASENETYLGNDDLWRETLDGQSFCNGVPRTLHVHQRSWKKFSDRMEFEWQLPCWIRNHYCSLPKHTTFKGQYCHILN